MSRQPADGSTVPLREEDGLPGRGTASGNPQEEEEQNGLSFSNPPPTAPTARSLLSKNLQATITYCSVFWSFGMCVAFLGPTIQDLGCQTGSKLSQMSWAFLAQSMCTLIGSMFGGFLVERCNSDPLLLLSTSMIAMTIALVPFCNSLGLLLIDMAVMGIFMGLIDTIANVSLLKIYGKLVSPFLQALHFCYGFGAFISPIVAEPFLLNEDCNRLIDNTTSDDELTIIARDVQEPTTMATLEEVQHKTKVRYAFWIMAVIQLPIIFLVLLLVCKRYCIDPIFGRGQASVRLIDRTLYEDLDKGAASTETTYADRRVFSSGKAMALTFFISLLLFLYDGLQAAYGGFIFTYAVKNQAIEVSASSGAYMTAVYWGSFALGRLISIPISTRCSLSVMLLCNLGGCLFAMAVELILRNSLAVLYFSSAIFGLFLSSIYPTSIALAESYIKMNGFVTSCLVIGAASGEMAFPIFVGKVLFQYAAYVFLIFCTCVAMFGIVIYTTIILLGTCTEQQANEAVKKVPVAENTLIWIRRNCCLTQSQESLLTGERDYYTTLADTNGAYTVVSSPEQIPMDKIPVSDMPPDNIETGKEVS